jgi:hypothetical protein
MQLDVTVALPRPRQCRHYVNLTNGVEAIPLLNELGIQYRWAITYSSRHVCVLLVRRTLAAALSVHTLATDHVARPAASLLTTEQLHHAWRTQLDDVRYDDDGMRPAPLATAAPPACTILTASIIRRRSFVRIQSTACEQQRFEQLMLELDADLLMHLALGYR